MKKIISIVLVAILALSLAACGGKNTADNSTQTEAASLESAEETSESSTEESSSESEQTKEASTQNASAASESVKKASGNTSTGSNTKSSKGSTLILNTDKEVAEYAISQGIPLGQVSWNEANKTVTFYIFELCKDRSAKSTYYGEKMSAEYNARRVMPTKGTRDAIVFKYINPNTNEYWDIIKQTDHYEDWDILFPANPSLDGNTRCDDNGEFYKDENGNLYYSGKPVSP